MENRTSLMEKLFFKCPSFSRCCSPYIYEALELISVQLGDDFYGSNMMASIVGFSTVC